MNKNYFFIAVILFGVFIQFAYAESQILDVTKEMAETALSSSILTINEMRDNNFSIGFVNDTLNEAQKVFQQVNYAEILRNSSSTSLEKSQAENILKLVSWNNLSYSDVLVYIREINLRKEQAFKIYDTISIYYIKIAEYEKQLVNVNESRILLTKASMSFYEDRYEEAESLLQQVNLDLETKKSELTLLNTLTRSTKNFIQLYLSYILVGLFILGVISFFLVKLVSCMQIKKKIKRLNAEEQVLIELIKKTEEERFKEEKISGLVYNIRIKKYKDRLNEIKQNLPVLKSRLKKI